MLVGEVADRADDRPAEDDLVHPVVGGNLVQERDVALRYQRRSEVLAEYAVDPLDVVGERGPGVSRRRDGYRAGGGAAGADPGEHGGVACVAPAKQDLAEVDAGHSYTRWGETNKNLGVFYIFPAVLSPAAVLSARGAPLPAGGSSRRIGRRNPG
ncbi:hypothetical protein DSECCO2_589360 [anaerobic digester metagenome]